MFSTDNKKRKSEPIKFAPRWAIRSDFIGYAIRKAEIKAKRSWIQNLQVDSAGAPTDSRAEYSHEFIEFTVTVTVSRCCCFAAPARRLINFIEIYDLQQVFVS